MDISNQELAQLARHYNTPEFIKSDPIQFPHRFTEKRDIEISAIVTSWISWGNRKQIILTATRLHDDIFQNQPYRYLQSREWEAFRDDRRCFYRTVRYDDFYQLMLRLWETYSQHADLEACVAALLPRCQDNPALALSTIFGGISGFADARKSSPCKRLWFCLRWLVRQDGIVDLGIWKNISPLRLIIPLDTHVHHVALHLGLTTRRSADITTARQITDHFREIFPDDPALGDFALFAYGIEKGI